MSCPVCGEQHRVISNSLETTSQLYNLVCRKCGWSSGPTIHGGIATCPSCHNNHCCTSNKVSLGGSSSNAGSSSSYTSSSSSSSSSDDIQNLKGGLYLLLLVAAIFLVGVVVVYGTFLLLFPGVLTTMLVDVWADFDSTGWVWTWCIVFSLVAFLFCGFNWKKYLVFDICLILLFLLLTWIISDFNPFEWSVDHMHLWKFWESFKK